MTVFSFETSKPSSWCEGNDVELGCYAALSARLIAGGYSRFDCIPAALDVLTGPRVMEER